MPEAEGLSFNQTKMHQHSSRYSEADQRYVSVCLGRTPHGVVGVAARRPKGEPTVIINRPLQPQQASWKPFPTLYWLVDPDLNTRIAEIERKGGVRVIEEAIAQNTAWQIAHREDNTSYALARWALLSDSEKQMAQELGMDIMLKTAGIGGVANHDAIKCLHTQYAFHLARHQTGSTAGQLIEQQFELSSIISPGCH